MNTKKIDSGAYSKFDLQMENFDGYFEWTVKGMSPEQRNKIPDNLKKKLILQSNGKMRPSKLAFAEKLFILQKAFDKKWYIVVEGQQGEEAMSMEHYQKFREQRLWNDVRSSEANLMLVDGSFVVGDKDLIRWLFHLNDVCVSGAYNYGLKVRNVRPQNIFKERKSLHYFIRLLLFYEGSKRRIIRDFSLSMPEFYCLLYFYDGEKKKASPLYEDVLSAAVSLNKGIILRAIKRLNDKKYLDRYGSGQDTNYSITSFGINVVNDILVKYVTPA